MTSAVPVALGFIAAVLASVGVLMLVPDRPRLRRRHGSGVRGLRLLATAGAAFPSLRFGGEPRDLTVRIAAAGYPGDLGPTEVMAAKLASALIGAAAGTVLAAGAPGRLGPALALASPVAAFMAPDVWLARRAAERARRVRRELPAMLDLLRVTVEAGGPLAAAMAAVGDRARGPLASEWRAVGREVSLGVPLRAALDDMAERLPVSEVRTFVAALERATRHGAPLADALGEQARDARFSLQRRVREEAARAGPKIQLVVALLLVPSVLLLVAAALAAALLEGAGGPLLGA